jgi:hypothetical protein
MEKWLDREKIKSEISGWLASNIPHFLLTIDDSQEFEDVTRWLEFLKEFKIAVAYLNTDSEVTRFGLLKEIVDEFGKETFPHFTALNNIMSSVDPQIIINQKIGTEIKAINADINTNTQTVNIHNPDLQSVIVFNIENRVNEFLDEFLTDLRNIDYGRTSIIICRFRGTGFDKLDEKFKGWFQDQFIRRVKSVKIKIIVLCESNAGKLSNLFDYKFGLYNLHLDEIIPVTKNYLNDTNGLFSKGVVDEDNTIKYKDFKIKLQRNMFL